MENISGNQLKKARHVANMTQSEAAKLLGISRGYLSQVENEKKIPSPQLQNKIDKLFGKTVESFFYTE